MKSPAFLLAVGLMLPYVTASDPNNDVMKLCELDFLHKLVELCANPKPRVRRQYDLSQASGDNDESRQMNMKMFQWISENGGSPQFVADYGTEPLYVDYKQYEKMLDELSDYNSESVVETKLPNFLPRRFIRNELSGTQLTEKCCVSGCTANEILHYCRP